MLNAIAHSTRAVSSPRHALKIVVNTPSSHLRLQNCFQGWFMCGSLSKSQCSRSLVKSSVAMHRPENNDVFEYSDKDFVLSTNTWAADSEFELSKFDLELHKRWDKAMKSGAFRYDINHITTRIIPGPKHYVAQLNLLRAKERRKPQNIQCTNQPFDPEQFNFTWVGPQELIFNLKRVHSASLPSDSRPELCRAVELEKVSGEKDVEATESPSPIPHLQSSAAVNGTTSAQGGKCVDERHALVINVSPMEYGHCLLVPQIDACLPQIVTETSIRVAIEMLLLSKHRGYRLGFNSLCAFASVNHLHYHAFYLEHELAVEHCPVNHLVGNLYEITTIPVPGFAFQVHGSTVEDISRQVHKITSYFQETDIAHNLFICRGIVFGEKRGSAKTTVRVFIWPRRKFVGTKSAEEFNVASIELGGHLPIRELEGYHSLTEEAVDAIIADSQLPAKQYEQIKNHVMGIFSPTPDQH